MRNTQKLGIQDQRLQPQVRNLFLNDRDVAAQVRFFPVPFKIIERGQPGALFDGVTLDEVGSRLCYFASDPR